MWFPSRLQACVSLFVICFFADPSWAQSFYWYGGSDGSCLRTDVQTLVTETVGPALGSARDSGSMALDSWNRVVYVIHRGALVRMNFDGTDQRPLTQPFHHVGNGFSGVAYDPGRAMVYVQLAGGETGDSCCLEWVGYEVLGCDTLYPGCSLVSYVLLGSGPFIPENPTFVGPDEVFYSRGQNVFRLDVPSGAPSQIQGEYAKGSFVVDPVERKIYYAHQSKHLLRTDLDGSHPETVAQNLFSLGHLISIDVNRGKLYWYDSKPQALEAYEGNLDATGVRFLQSGALVGYGVPDLHACDRGDCDGDGLNTHADALSGLLPCAFGPGVRSGEACCCADANGDGQVDLRDVAAFQRLDPAER